jgi:hypothetical protein
MAKLIACSRCKASLGEIEKGRIKKGTCYLCESCGRLIVAEAFKKPDSFEWNFDAFLKGFKGG